jgi:Disintegrin
MKFSQCSLGNICEFFRSSKVFHHRLNCVAAGSLMQDNAQGKTNTSCLLDPDPSRQTISLQMCGNGIVEAGEDCDPGKDTISTCCDSTTCKFTSGSVCDPLSSQCCGSKCTFAPSTQVCRPSKDSQCDVAEMCTGNSSACPADVTAPNGESMSCLCCILSLVAAGKSCGSNGLACASGQCTSISKQCQMIGASMNLQSACPSKDQNCQVSCQDPTQSNQCVVLQSQLIDGSPCGE